MYYLLITYAIMLNILSVAINLLRRKLARYYSIIKDSYIVVL